MYLPPALLAYTVLIFSYGRQRKLYTGDSLLELLQQRPVKFSTRDRRIPFTQAIINAPGDSLL
jgi:hypothetical protein